MVKSSKIVPPQLYMLSTTIKACHGIGVIAATPPTILFWGSVNAGYVHVSFGMLVFAVVEEVVLVVIK